MIDNLYVDLEMVEYLNDDYLGIDAVDLVRDLPCKYRPDGDYSKWIYYAIQRKYLVSFKADFYKLQNLDYPDYCQLRNTSEFREIFCEIDKINSFLRDCKCFYYTNTIKYSDLEYLGRLVDTFSINHNSHKKYYDHPIYSTEAKMNNFDHSNYDNTDFLDVKSRFYVRKNLVS